ncbi:MAG: hypothetical protein AAFP90_17785 [Planctomycetota bacterium]
MKNVQAMSQRSPTSKVLKFGWIAAAVGLGLLLCGCSSPDVTLEVSMQLPGSTAVQMHDVVVNKLRAETAQHHALRDVTIARAGSAKVFVFVNESKKMDFIRACDSLNKGGLGDARIVEIRQMNAEETIPQVQQDSQPVLKIEFLKDATKNFGVEEKDVLQTVVKLIRDKHPEEKPSPAESIAAVQGEAYVQDDQTIPYDKLIRVYSADEPTVVVSKTSYE